MLKAITLHLFFHGTSTPRPAVFVAGACHSSCVLKPSKCILDVNNAELQAESSKHAHIACKNPIQSQSEDEASITHASESDASAGGDTDVEMEDSDSVNAKGTYELTKAMGDQDHKVIVAHHPNYPATCLLYLSRSYVLDQSLIVRLMYGPSSSLRKSMLMQLWVISKKDMYAQSASEYFFFSINLSLMDGVQRDAGVSAKNCFFLGNITTLCNHISRFVYFSSFLMISCSLPLQTCQSY